MARLCRVTDRDLIFYLSYYHCLQTGKKSFNKHILKGYTTVLRFNWFQESRLHHIIGTQNQSKLNTQWVSLKRFINGHEHNDHTLGYMPCVEKGIVSIVCLKMSKQMKREIKYSWHCFYFGVKVKLTKSTFVLSI